MKRRYERPNAYIEEFTPNEYVAACGDHGKVYKFECNAGEKINDIMSIILMKKGDDNIWQKVALCGKTIIIRVKKHMKLKKIRDLLMDI